MIRYIGQYTRTYRNKNTKFALLAHMDCYVGISNVGILKNK
uniref:Uncharacterized protein n=1 Tax=Arundo donax TaxID=35708 RepID=A0A0A9GKU9_ARUDO